MGDVAWAPQCSTVFAAGTDSGHVYVFDLARSRAAAACVQKVARKARLTRLAFNARHPVLLVGTEHGGVVCLKLSPNLRRSFNPGGRRGCAALALMPVAWWSASAQPVAAPAWAAGRCPASCASRAHPAGAAGAADVGDSLRSVARIDSQRVAARAAEAARLEGILEAAAKCNAALREEDFAML